MINSITAQATYKVYNKTYTITFRNGVCLDVWRKEARRPESYGGKKAFVELTTTRDAHTFGILDCAIA